MIKHNPDNIYSALGDWLVLGEHAGFRKEWHDRTHLKKYKYYQRNIDGSSTAFILYHFELRGKKQRRTNNDSQKDINKSNSVNLKWRFQNK